MTDIFRYASTHTRSGRFYTPVALIQGNCDGRHGFGLENAWGWRGEAEIPRDYRVAAFVGYNLAKEEDCDRITGFVRRGGTLLLTRAHLAKTTDFDMIKRGEITEADNHSLAFTDGAPVYETEHICGKCVRICRNIRVPDEILSMTDEGSPLTVKYHIGKGSVILVNALCHPSNEAICKEYESLLMRFMIKETERESDLAE